jgi:putative hydrolase of the HAD superfamily
MSDHSIKAVFFDAAGTLFTVNGSVGAIYARLAEKHGKTVTVKDLEAGFRRCFAVAPPMAFPGASPTEIPTLEKQWWKTVVQDVFAPLGTFPAFDSYFDELFTFFAQPEAWQLYPETLETLQRLKRREVIVGVISNFDSRLLGLLDGFGMSHFFDPIVISTQAGAAKPEGTIFSQALAHHKLLPAQAMHVGDSYEMDIEGARRAGLTPVLIDRRAEPSKSDDYLSVSSLLELADLL